MKHFLVFILLLLPLRAEVPALKYPVISAGSEGTTIQNWLLGGPFFAENSQDALDQNYYDRRKPNEADTVLEHLNVALADSRKTDVRTIKAGADGRVDLNHANRSETPEGALQTAMYAACVIESESCREAWLMLGSDDGVKVWLNSELLHEKRGRRAYRAYDDAICLKLRPGRNYLLLKVANIDGEWLFAARLERNVAAATSTALARASQLLRHEVVDDLNRLELDIPALPRSAAISAEVCGPDGKAIRALALNTLKSEKEGGLPCGLYQLVIKNGPNRYEQKFVLGSVEKMIVDLKVKCERLCIEERIRINIDTLLRRLEILDRPNLPEAGVPLDHRQAFSQDIEHKVVFTMNALITALARIDAGEEPFRQRTGLHIRGFLSRIDDQVLHYRLFVPSSYRGNGSRLPLVIMQSPVFSVGRPYLESVFMADQFSAETWSNAAEKLGVGILWPGYRVQPYGNPIDFAHIDEVIAAVSSDYLIDMTRLYLYGHCSSGLGTTMEALRNPDRYAAIELLNPVLRRLRNRYDDQGEYVEQKCYRQWLADTDPLSSLAEKNRIPIWIIHDGIDPDHGPLAQSIEYVEIARAYGTHVKFDRTKTRVSVNDRLKWLTQHVRPDIVSPPLQVSKNNGPLSRAFTERFVLVTGTDGSQSEKAASQSWSSAFRTAWKKTNFVDCRVALDVDLNQSMEEKSNLVLIGNEKCNTVWKNLATDLSIVVRPGEVSVGSQKWTGANLAIQAWVRHPKDPARRIVLIGSADLEKSGVGTMELALDGWFDFAVWQKVCERVVLVDAGRYENQ